MTETTYYQRNRRVILNRMNESKQQIGIKRESKK